MKLHVLCVVILGLVIAEADDETIEREEIVKGDSVRRFAFQSDLDSIGITRGPSELKIGVCSGTRQVKETVHRRAIPHITKYLRVSRVPTTLY